MSCTFRSPAYLTPNHCRFVSALHIPPSHPSILVSGGGDPHIFLWDWMTGKQKHAIPILDAVTPYLRVKVNPSSRRKWGRDEEDGGGGISAQPGKKKKGGTIDEEDIEPENDGNEMAVDEPELTVLAINKIESVNVGDRTTIVFTATGYASVYFPSPQLPTNNYEEAQHYSRCLSQRKARGIQSYHRYPLASPFSILPSFVPQEDHQSWSALIRTTVM